MNITVSETFSSVGFEVANNDAPIEISNKLRELSKAGVPAVAAVKTTPEATIWVVVDFTQGSPVVLLRVETPVKPS